MITAVPLEYEFADKFKISGHFGRSDAFALIEDGKLTKIIPNPAKGFKLAVSGCKQQKYATELAGHLKTHSVEAIEVKRMGKYMK